MRSGREKPGSSRISASSAAGTRELLAQPLVLGVGVAEAVEHGGQAAHSALHAAELAGRDEVRHQHERDRVAREDDVVLGEPGFDLLLDSRAAIAQLGELDQVLQLQVVDVVDQALYRHGTP